MPIIFEKQINAAKKLAVWQITEPLDFFLDKLNLKANLELSAKRQMENAVCSVLLNYLGEKNLHLQLSRDEFGKPFILKNLSSVSFSHSKEMVACIIDMEGKPVGIDIELMRQRILALSPKFINAEDRTPFSDVLHSHLVWGAKEVLYKLYAKKELDFLCHLTVKFDKKYTGTINKNGRQMEFHLDFTEINNFILVWNI